MDFVIHHVLEALVERGAQEDGRIQAHPCNGERAGRRGGRPESSGYLPVLKCAWKTWAQWTEGGGHPRGVYVGGLGHADAGGRLKWMKTAISGLFGKAVRNNGTGQAQRWGPYRGDFPPNYESRARGRKRTSRPPCDKTSAMKTQEGRKILYEHTA